MCLFNTSPIATLVQMPDGNRVMGLSFELLDAPAIAVGLMEFVPDHTSRAYIASMQSARLEQSNAFRVELLLKGDLDAMQMVAEAIGCGRAFEYFRPETRAWANAAKATPALSICDEYRIDSVTHDLDYGLLSAAPETVAKIVLRNRGTLRAFNFSLANAENVSNVGVFKVYATAAFADEFTATVAEAELSVMPADYSRVRRLWDDQQGALALAA